MAGYRVTGGRPLYGEVIIESAKNAVLPIVAAALMCKQPVTLTRFPEITDARNMLKILESLGCRCDCANGEAIIDPRGAAGYVMPDDLSRVLRSSIFMLGPLVARFRKAVAAYPGGCEIGLRPIDIHLKALRQLNVTVEERGGQIYCDASGMRGGSITLDFPSVGATENAMMAAALCPGVTVIHNAAREPEIVDLASFINAMGGRIRGAGDSAIEIRGVSELSGGQYRPMPDRIEAGTFLVAAAITGGSVFARGARKCDMVAIVDKLSEAGCDIDCKPEGITLNAGALKGFSLNTSPYPGFPTDMQPQFMALACASRESSVLVENLFENRYSHVGELRKMGADIIVSDRAAIVRGGMDGLHGARVTARDLRAGAGLTLAALKAHGQCEVSGIEYIDRGYVHFVDKLRALGGQIEIDQRIGG